ATGLVPFLIPLSRLLFRLAASPRLKERRHRRSIGRPDGGGNPSRVYAVLVDIGQLRARVEELIRRHDLIPSGGDVTCLVSGGAGKGIRPRREDGVVRPLLTVWREETEAYCRGEGLDFRTDSSNRETKRGLIRDEILPRLRELHPAADLNLLRLAEGDPSALDALLASTAGSRRLDLGGGMTAVREYENVWLERTA